MSVSPHLSDDGTLALLEGHPPLGQRPGGSSSPYFGMYYSILFQETLVYVPEPLIRLHPEFESQFRNGHLRASDIPDERAHIITHYIWQGTLQPLQRTEETELAKQQGTLITLFKLRQDAHRFRLWGLEEMTTEEMHLLGRQVGLLKLMEIALEENDWDFRANGGWLREFFAKRVNDRSEYISEPKLRRAIDWGNARLVGSMEELKMIVELKIKLQELLEARLLDPFEGAVIWNTPGSGEQQDRWNCLVAYEPQKPESIPSASSSSPK
ncbi:hypothetical protein FSARC_4254 [Fusarium sarcochroum]|uniref:Uncharacterized protein n=1 Tax=Fusarium sarcochroum TaxID=1208366 RepID=A0A8H4U255_9HYPO|nr:hypothetical protein FSARC_4254 [Fusarium sarcochroum]